MVARYVVSLVAYDVGIEKPLINHFLIRHLLLFPQRNSPFLLAVVQNVYDALIAFFPPQQMVALHPNRTKRITIQPSTASSYLEAYKLNRKNGGK